MSEPTYTKGQQEFIEQYARKELVRWCHTVITSGEEEFFGLDANNPYVQHALNRKSPWLSKKGTRYKILAAGWAAATSFLKR